MPSGCDIVVCQVSGTLQTANTSLHRLVARCPQLRTRRPALALSSHTHVICVLASPLVGRVSVKEGEGCEFVTLIKTRHSPGFRSLVFAAAEPLQHVELAPREQPLANRSSFLPVFWRHNVRR